MKVLGVDPSLTSTGLALASHGASGPLLTTCRVRVGAGRGHERLRTIRTEVMQAARGADLVVIEGPAYGSAAGARQSGHHERAGLWWLLTHALWGAGVPCAVVPPNLRARYATGRGNAAKDQVLAAVIRRYPDVDIDGNDEADALVLAVMGARHLGRPLEPSLPGTHLAAMDAVPWPALVSS